MRSVKSFTLVLLVSAMFSFYAFAAEKDLVAWWKFDEVKIKTDSIKIDEEEFILKKVPYVFENVSKMETVLNGAFYKVVPGVIGKALRFDGYTGYIDHGRVRGRRRFPGVPKVSGTFSIEAWIALGAYPKHWCPIVDNQRDINEGYFNGYFFGVDANGRLMFRIAAKGKNEIVVSSDIIPLGEWRHVAGVYTPKDGMAIYLNGKVAGTKKLKDKFTPAEHVSLLIAKSRVKRRPYGTIRPFGTAPAYTFFDGIIDELKIFNSGLSANQIARDFSKNKPKQKPDLPKRVLPAGPKGPGKFSAINTTLKYYDAWDAAWHVGDNADVVVRFDESPCRFVFWRGTNYTPNWVTENGIWYNNAFDETWDPHGCCEPMSDKQCRHAYAKVIESNDARVVILWRYALINNWYQFARIDSLTGWGDWANETYIIYPDMVGVRKDKLLSKEPGAPHEWQESIMVMGPGQRPDGVLELAALTLANMKGETHTYSWEKHTPPGIPREPEGANIQLVNTRSKYTPFSIIRPQSNPHLDIYAGEIRRDVCVFPWWNHWPVAPRPCDGRWAMYADRASHASLTHWIWNPYSKTKNSMTKIMLNGLTDKGIDYLVTLAKSWSNPPELKISGSNFESSGYDPSQRAYVLNCKEPENILNFELSANENSPIVNPAFVIENWGDKGTILKINGKEVKRGKDFRFGHRYTLESTDLIVWIRYNSNERVKFSLSPLSN